MSLPSKDYTDWHERASWELKGSGQTNRGLTKADIIITIFAENRRAGDLTNKAESVMDLLVDNGVLEDDNWFVCGNIQLKFGGIDKLDPRAEVTILNYERKEK